MFAAAVPAFAQRVEMKGVGTYQYEGTFFAGAKPTPAEQSKALAQARLAAWRNYVAALNPARQQAIAQHEREVTENLDKFIIDYVVIDTVKDSDAKALKVVARFAFNDEAVNQFLAARTVGDGQQAARSQDSLFSFLFMARKATAVTQFDARRTEVRQAEAVRSEAADGGVSATVSASSGGSSQRKEDAVTYAVTSSQDLDSAMGEVLSTSGIEYVGYDDIVTTCKGTPVKKFQAEFVQGDELSPQTRADIISAARACDVRYFAYGTIDTQVASVDPVSGNQRVYVAVRSQLWDISKKLPRKIGSVGPKQYSGLGPDQSVASRNALSVASRDLARTLVDQLNAKGIR
jgi:hypothetical protein